MLTKLSGSDGQIGMSMPRGPECFAIRQHLLQKENLNREEISHGKWLIK